MLGLASWFIALWDVLLFSGIAPGIDPGMDPGIDPGIWVLSWLESIVIILYYKIRCVYAFESTLFSVFIYM